MMKRIISLICLMTILLGLNAYAALIDQRGPTEEVKDENAPEFVDMYRITIENTRGGAVTGEKNGESIKIATVLVPANDVNPAGYTASGWAPLGAVAATAVNAVHIKLSQGPEKGIIMSVLPKEMVANPSDFNAMYKNSASIVLDSPAGTGFFGGGWAPFIGNPVYVDKGNGFAPLPEDYKPADGDKLQIRVQRPARMPASITFENRFGGRVILRYPDGEEKTIAMVLKPVMGVGRFGGSEFADVGRIRANHTGVICISTSPLAQIGGFQIIPENHGMSPEMGFARQLTQWMVVGPPRVDDPSTEGVAPLFRYFLQPVYYGMGATGRTIEQMLDMFIAQARINNGDWQRMPSLTGRDDTALKDLTAVRILFPLQADFLRK